MQPSNRWLDPLLDMLGSVKRRQMLYQTLLMDSWYATNEIFKYLLSEHKLFYCPSKANRKIDDTQGQQPYKQVQETCWSATDVKEGNTIKLYKMPLATYFKLFPVLLTPTRTDDIITNDLNQCHSEAADQESSIRWTIERGSPSSFTEKPNN